MEDQPVTAKDQPVDEQPIAAPAAGSAAPMSRTGIRLTAALSATVLVLAVVLGWLMVSNNAAQASENTRMEAAVAAAARTKEMFEWDHTTVRDQMASALENTTGEFHTSFEQEINDTVIPRTEEQERTVEVTVISQATIESTSDTASVLVFFNQRAQANTGPKATVTPSRVKMDLRKVDGVWKVSGLDVI